MTSACGKYVKIPSRGEGAGSSVCYTLPRPSPRRSVLFFTNSNMVTLCKHHENRVVTNLYSLRFHPSSHQGKEPALHGVPYCHSDPGPPVRSSGAGHGCGGRGHHPGAAAEGRRGQRVHT